MHHLSSIVVLAMSVVTLSFLLLLLGAYLFVPLTFNQAYAYNVIVSPASNNFNTFAMYKNAQYGFDIQYPSNWQKIEFSQGIERSGRNIVINFLSPSEGTFDRFREYLIIEVGDLNSEKLLPYSSSPSSSGIVSRYVNQQISDYKKLFQRFHLLESSSLSNKTDNNNTNSIFNDYSLSSKIAYTYHDPTAGIIRVMETYLLNKDEIFLLSFHSEATNYAKYLPTIQKMVSSFSLNQ